MGLQLMTLVYLVILDFELFEVQREQWLDLTTLKLLRWFSEWTGRGGILPSQ